MARGSSTSAAAANPSVSSTACRSWKPEAAVSPKPSSSAWLRKIVDCVISSNANSRKIPAESPQKV